MNISESWKCADDVELKSGDEVVDLVDMLTMWTRWIMLTLQS